MALIKRADVDNYVRDAYVMDLNDLESRGRSCIDAAHAQAAQILADAKKKREELLSTASEDGFTKGHAKGLEEGNAKGVEIGTQEARDLQMQLLDQLSQMWIAQLDAFEQQRDSMLAQARTQIVELGAMIAQRVTRRIVELDPSIVLNQMDAALSCVTEPTRLVLAVHPDDVEIAQQEIPKLIERFSRCEHAQVVTDTTLERGSCVARTSGGGIIDASLTKQLDRIINAILPMDSNATTHERIPMPNQQHTTVEHAEIESTDLQSDAQEDAA